VRRVAVAYSSFTAYSALHSSFYASALFPHERLEPRRIALELQRFQITTVRSHSMSHLESAPSHESELTPREREILNLIAKGCTNRQVAETLHVAVGTVEVHIHNILKKLEVKSRMQAIFAAMRLGLIDNDNAE
jgi:DNA-binding NarL/FixJ family response regulator